MTDFKLKAELRKILGRKVKKLRKDGIIPAHVFGHNIKTLHIQIDEKEFEKIAKVAGETSVVDLSVNSKTHPVLIRGVQVHPLTDKPLHIDFYQVSLKEKVKVAVPVEIVGVAPAVEKKLGVLLTPLAEIEIEALPQNLPEKIEVDVSKLENVGDAIHVKDLKIDREKIEVLTDSELIVANIGELVTKEAEEVLAAEAAEREAAAAAEAAEAPPEAPLEEAAPPTEEAAPSEEKPTEGAAPKKEAPPEKKKSS